MTLKISPSLPNTARLSLKIRIIVGWVEERNPTSAAIVGFRKASTQPTKSLNRAVLPAFQGEREGVGGSVT
ncbi:MAG: hypothetical protein KME64_09560 [Scytonematopsis contorta HA4267-MV1]|nr:hypothetical protein [Scytonematopsis contorta HA4267-MV1]